MTAVSQMRTAASRAGESMLFLHAGDQYVGTLWDIVYAQAGDHKAPGR
jgi:hypothetical protein